MKIQQRLQAIQALQKFLENNQRPAWRMFNASEYLSSTLVNEYIKQGDWLTAFDDTLMMLLEGLPSVPESLFYTLSHLALKLKDYELVIQIQVFMFEHSRAYEEKNLAILLDCLNRCHQHTKAIEFYQSFTDKELISTHLAYVRAINGLGEHQQALEILETLKIDRHDESYLIVKVLCFRGMGRYSEVLDILNQLEQSKHLSAKLYCARQFTYLGMHARSEAIMEELMRAQPNNASVMAEYLQCIACMPNGRSKALAKCVDFLSQYADSLRLEELKKIYLLQANYSSKDDGIQLYQQLCLRYPEDMSILTEFIRYAMRYRLDGLIDELKKQLSESYQIEMDDILQRPLLKQALGLIDDQSHISLECSFGFQQISILPEISSIMTEVQDETADEVYLVGSTVIDLMTQQQENIELKDIDLLCHSTRAVFKGFMPNPHVKNYYTRASRHTHDYECGLVVMDSSHMGADFLRAHVLSRDFTICALFATMQGKVFDPTGKGFFDVQNKILRTVIDAKECLQAHPVRYLRAIKYQARGFMPEQTFHLALQAFSVEAHLNHSHFMAALRILMNSANYQRHLDILSAYQQLPVIKTHLKIASEMTRHEELRDKIIENINQNMWSFKQSNIEMNLPEDKTLEFLQKQLAEKTAQHQALVTDYQRLFEYRDNLKVKNAALTSRAGSLKVNNNFTMPEELQQIQQNIKEQLKANRELKKQIHQKDEEIEQVISRQLSDIFSRFRNEKKQKNKECRQLDKQLSKGRQVLLAQLASNRKEQVKLHKIEEQQIEISKEQAQKLALLNRMKADLALAPKVEFYPTESSPQEFSAKNYYSSGQLGFESLVRFVTIESLRNAMHLEIVREELSKTNPNIFKIIFHLQVFYDFKEDKIPQQFKDMADENEKLLENNSNTMNECLEVGTKYYYNLNTYHAHYYLMKALKMAEKPSEVLECIRSLAAFYMHQKDLYLFQKLYEKYKNQLSRSSALKHEFDLFFTQIRDECKLSLSFIDSQMPSKRHEPYWWMIALQTTKIYEEVGISQNPNKTSRAYLSSIYDRSSNLEELALVCCHLNQGKVLDLLVHEHPELSSLEFLQTWFREHQHPGYFRALQARCLDVTKKPEPQAYHFDTIDKVFLGFEEDKLKALYDKTSDPDLLSKLGWILVNRVSSENDSLMRFQYLFKLQRDLPSLKQPRPQILAMYESMSVYDWATVDTHQLALCAKSFMDISDWSNAELFYLMLLEITPYSNEVFEGLISIYFHQKQWASLAKMLKAINELLPYLEMECFTRVSDFAMNVHDLKQRVNYYQEHFKINKLLLKAEISQLTQQIEELGEVVSFDKRYRQLNDALMDSYWNYLDFCVGSDEEEYLQIMQKIAAQDSHLGLRYGFAHLHLALGLRNNEGGQLLANQHMLEAISVFGNLQNLYPEFDLNVSLEAKLFSPAFYFQKNSALYHLIQTSEISAENLVSVLSAFVTFARPDGVSSRVMNYFRQKEIQTSSPQVDFYLSLCLGQKPKAIHLCHSHPTEIIDSKRLGWSINEENINRFFENREEFLIESNRRPININYTVMFNNIYNELIYAHLLEGQLSKVELNFKLGLLKTIKIGDKFVWMFFYEYIQALKSNRHEDLIIKAYEFVLEKRQALPANLLEYVDSNYKKAP